MGTCDCERESAEFTERGPATGAKEDSGRRPGGAGEEAREEEREVLPPVGDWIEGGSFWSSSCGVRLEN